MSDLEKQLRVLQKKLARSEKERAANEAILEASQRLYKQLHMEVEAAKKTIEEAHDELQKTQNQLVQAEKLASLGQLTAGIAHELKNPLNFVNNFAELNEELEDELLEDLLAFPDAHNAVEVDLQTIKENTRRIGHYGKRADGIVRSMMEHASISTGERQLVDVNNLVREYTELARRSQLDETTANTIAVDEDYGGDAGTVELVKQDLGRVILILLANAFDAVLECNEARDKDFQPSVRVSTRRTDGFVRISVEDNGCGISEEIKPRIFEPFFQAEQTMYRKYSGTGLGLAICRGIVESQEGKIWVESEPGIGSKFFFSLPKTDASLVLNRHICEVAKEVDKTGGEFVLLEVKFNSVKDRFAQEKIDEAFRQLLIESNKCLTGNADVALRVSDTELFFVAMGSQKLSQMKKEINRVLLQNDIDLKL